MSVRHIFGLASKQIDSPYVRVGVSIVFSVVLLYLAIRNVSVNEVAQVLSKADVKFLALALVSVVTNTVSKAIRWQVLLGKRSTSIQFHKILVSLLIGQMLNNFLPARAGDLSRAFIIGGLGAGKVFVLGTVILEKVLDLVSYTILFLFLVLLIPLPLWISESGYSLAGVTFVIALTVFLLTWKREKIFVHLLQFTKKLPEMLSSQLVPRIESALSSLEVLENNKDFVRLAGWSAIIWSTAVFNNYLVLKVLDISLPMTASMLLLFSLQAGISFTSIPGRIGIFEYICILVLAVYGIDQTTAFSYGVLLHAIVFLPAAISGAISFWIFGMPVKQVRQISL